MSFFKDDPGHFIRMRLNPVVHVRQSPGANMTCLQYQTGLELLEGMNITSHSFRQRSFDCKLRRHKVVVVLVKPWELPHTLTHALLDLIRCVSCQSVLKKLLSAPATKHLAQCL